ncbi:FAS1 domain-containing protein [Aspergillus similis]
MRYPGLVLSLTALAIAFQDPLSYRSVDPVYTPSKAANTTTLLDFVSSRPDLSNLTAVIERTGGFKEAFNTEPTWSFTFFAPNNDAFENTGRYFLTFYETPKGKWWTGNTVIHHYVPNTILKKENFNETYQRVQTGSYLFVGAQLDNEELVLNQVAKVVESDISMSGGVVHIIDHILDPAAQIFDADIPWLKQTFIAGSCSNPALPYC